MRSRIALGVTVTLSLALFLVAAPSADLARCRTNDDRAARTVHRTPRFHFARLRYPGGIPGYIINWYTDYPNMDTHLSMLAARMTNIDVGDPDVVDADSA